MYCPLGSSSWLDVLGVGNDAWSLKSAENAEKSIGIKIKQNVKEMNILDKLQ